MNQSNKGVCSWARWALGHGGHTELSSAGFDRLPNPGPELSLKIKFRPGIAAQPVMLPPAVPAPLVQAPILAALLSGPLPPSARGKAADDGPRVWVLPLMGEDWMEFPALDVDLTQPQLWWASQKQTSRGKISLSLSTFHFFVSLCLLHK